MWHKWQSIEAFDAWHSAVKNALGIPHPNCDADGTPQADAQWTTAYTSPVVVAADDVRAVVEGDCPEVEGLGEPCDPPPQPTEF